MLSLTGANDELGAPTADHHVDAYVTTGVGLYAYFCGKVDNWIANRAPDDYIGAQLAPDHFAPNMIIIIGSLRLLISTLGA